MIVYGYKDEEGEDKKYKILALGISILLHAIVLVCFIFLGLKHQVPPPPEYGIEIDMGGGGGGTHHVANSSSQAAPQEKLLTQDQEETTALPSSRKNMPQPVKTNRTTNVTEPTPSEEPAPTINQNALFQKRNTNNSGTGTGSGSGSGIGSGSGSGIGSGNGSGVGNSDGDGFFLNGRPVIKKAFPKSKNNLNGIVIVEFRANPEGKVVYAKAGVRGTTITAPHVWEACEEAARNSLFQSKANANAEERGTITYRFVLQ